MNIMNFENGKKYEAPETKVIMLKEEKHLLASSGEEDW